MSAKRAVVAGLLFVLIGTMSVTAQVAQIYAACEGKSTLSQYDYVTGVETTLYNTTGHPDDLVLNSLGQLIYSVPTQGTVNLFDPTTGINTVLATNIGGARDLIITPDGNNLMIAKNASPASIYEYNFSSGTTTIFFPKTKGITSMNGLSFDVYGNFYAVANRTEILQLNPQTAAIVNTLVLETGKAGGADGLTYDSYTNSLWTTHDSNTLGDGLVQIPVQASGFVSTPPGFSFYPINNMGGLDGIKSDGSGNLYIGAIWTAPVYNIPTNTLLYNPVVKGADGVALVPDTYGAQRSNKTTVPQSARDAAQNP